MTPHPAGKRKQQQHVVTRQVPTGSAITEAVEALGGLDVVVANAGAAVFGHVLEVHPDDFDRARRNRPPRAR